MGYIGVKGQLSLEDTIREQERTQAVIEVMAKEAITKLKPLGFEGFSARMLLAAINEALEADGISPIQIGRLKFFLTQLGYKQNEQAYHPAAHATYSAWTKE